MEQRALAKAQGNGLDLLVLGKGSRVLGLGFRVPTYSPQRVYVGGYKVPSFLPSPTNNQWVDLISDFGPGRFALSGG